MWTHDQILLGGKIHAVKEKESQNCIAIQVTELMQQYTDWKTTLFLILLDFMLVEIEGPATYWSNMDTKDQIQITYSLLHCF